jgi:hypothetical protein
LKIASCFLTAGDPKGPPREAQAEAAWQDCRAQQEPIFANTIWRLSIIPAAEIASPDHARPGIMLPENAFANDKDAEPLVRRRRDLAFISL